MIQLLRLSDFDGKVPEMPDVADDEFYEKVVKVKGPKSRKEVERLDNWIKYLLSNSGREPLRLAHLLLAKAAVVSCDMDDGEVKRSKRLTGNSSITLRAPSNLEGSHVQDSLKNRRTGDHGPVKPERPSGNRVAVRKYREKKKAQNAYLEEEVKKLRVVNRVLTRKLQLQAALEAEAVRLRSLLMGLKAQIGNELGVSPLYKQDCNGASHGCIGRD
ncbi:hypothetical protein L1987_62984 [Smallanthus sonchifolius]|uniref:Uncharacterized protein n=1 Tax=Smallanthus sonchifolius TaxID=185202 RepID=A0ACB9CC72_9ASTR|nr:hypothetical protein L1987_62984 [Smallanthus sonchifolius]